jgi:hypothetical protein
MKNSKLLVGLMTLISIVGVTFVASAEDVAPENDVTMVGSLQPHQTKVKTLNLIAGENKIIVSSDDDPLFSCQFVNDSGFVGLNQEKVPNCNGVVTSKLPMTIQLEVTNETDKTLDYRVNLHRSPPKAKGKKK